MAPRRNPGSCTGPHATAALGAWLGVDIVMEDGNWPPADEIHPCIFGAASALARHPRMQSMLPAEACIALSSDTHVRRLNKTHRGKDGATNVLSFPAARGPPASPGDVRFLGDIILAVETLDREAAEAGLPFAHHLQHLVIHGLLHLLGFDHEDDTMAADMEKLETEILAGLGIADPYAIAD